ncbi:hypothetical protein [Chitinophaga tropicalis]|uniref:Uncharacterized protein n=1 Tax=Chitinophaga tropicalis TaxID=2683588 RepID=A0A7K1U173_9BACT|nr:hypothetical protein [Chitinophaga tropicalis]MVT08109.1 hypothetical protein [Chitinophaga tropicalis]
MREDNAFLSYKDTTCVRFSPEVRWTEQDDFPPGSDVALFSNNCNFKQDYLTEV